MFLAGLRQGVRDRRAMQFEMKLLERAQTNTDTQDRAG